MEYAVELRKEFMQYEGDYSELFSNGKCSAKYAEWLEAVSFIRKMKIDHLRKEVAQNSTLNDKQSTPCSHNRQELSDGNYHVCKNCGAELQQ